MGKPVSRVGDMDSGHAPWLPSPIVSGAGTVMVNSIPAARSGDSLSPHILPGVPPATHPAVITGGSSTVMIESMPAARIMDMVDISFLAGGSGDVLAGD